MLMIQKIIILHVTVFTLLLGMYGINLKVCIAQEDDTSKTLVENKIPDGIIVLSKESTKWDLDGLVKEAIQHNPQLLSKQFLYNSALSAVDSAYWQFFPSPYVQLQQANNASGHSLDQRALTAGIQQPIWSGGRLTAGYNAAKSDARSADIVTDEVRYSLAIQVANTYQSFLQSRERVAAQREGNRRLEDFAAMIERRVKNGISAEVDKSLVQSRLNQGNSDLSVAVAAELTALVRLEQLVGRSININDIENASLFPPLPAKIKDAEISKIIMTHPTLRRLDADIETAKYQSDLQKSTLWPTASIKAEYQSSLSSRNSTPDDGRIYLNISYAPGAGLSVLSTIRQSESRVSSQKELYQASKRDLQSQIAAEYNDCSSSFARIYVSGVILKSTNEVLNSYKRMFIAGKRSWLDVLNAARELTQFEQLMADTKAQYVGSEYRLRIYTGENLLLNRTGK